ncbi:SIP domain-containing protein [Microbacterium sp.]|uniref:SIP domain-containing protein n=1 Tax=Microbacterium sp. TaxID=51671 RepID=UPI003A889BEE
MTSTVLPATSRRAARRERVQYLVAADETSLPELEALLVTLPLCATGRAFVEVPDVAWIAPLAAPPRMTVAWLDRSRRTGEPGSGRGCRPGQALARAVAGWAEEMLCVAGDTTRVHLLGGYLGSADIFEHLTTVGVPASAIAAPVRFGLTVV